MPSSLRTPMGFPNSVPVTGAPLILSLPLLTNAKVFFVSSVTGADAASHGSKDRPFKSIQFASTQCTADAGDTLIALPGHVETVASAGAVTLAKNGVRIKGLGEGADRPVWNFTATAATVLVTGNNITFENMVGTLTVDSVVSPFVISGTDCSFGTDDSPMEWQDATALIEAVCAVKTAATALRLTIVLRYKGFIAGNAVLNAVQLIGAAGARVRVDFYGIAATAIVEFLTTSCKDVRVEGTFYCSGVTNGTKNVVDTVGSSTWSVDVFDAAAGMRWTGGSGTAATLGSPIGASSLNVPNANNTTNTLERDVIGNMTDTLIDVVGTNKTLMAYAKGILANLSGAAGVATWPTAATYASAVSLAEVLAYVQDGVRRGAGTILPAATSLYDLLAGTNGIPTAFTTAAAPAAAISMAGVLHEMYDQQEKGVQTSAAAISLATVSIFTIAGGPIEVVELYAIWQAQAQAVATTLQFNMLATVGGATTISAASASQSGVAAGSSLLCAGTAFNTTPVTTAAGTVVAGTVKFICPAGSLQYIAGTSANTSTMIWFLRYKPLARGVTVVAAF